MLLDFQQHLLHDKSIFKEVHDPFFLEFIVAKHRNGGLSNIRLKFISNLGKFENIDNFDSPFEYQSKINQESPKINPDQAFESGTYRGEDGEDIPF